MIHCKLVSHWLAVSWKIVLLFQIKRMTMNLSVATHKFCTGDEYKDEFAVYAVFRDLLGITGQISNNQMDKQVVRYFFTHTTIDWYGWRPVAKHKALALSNGVMICFVCQGQTTMKLKFYGDKRTFNKKFIYILYDEQKYTYYGLSVIERDGSGECLKRFDNHQMVKDLLGEFIENDLQYTGVVNLEFDDNPIVNEPIVAGEEVADSEDFTNDIGSNEYSNTSEESSSNQFEDDHYLMSTKIMAKIPTRQETEYDPDRHIPMDLSEDSSDIEVFDDMTETIEKSDVHFNSDTSQSF